MTRGFLPPATKLGQGYIFTGVCDSVHRGVCLSACWDTNPPSWHIPPLEADLLEQTPSPWEQTPPKGPDIPLEQTPPRHRACWEIRSTRGRYASYWNAILLALMLRSMHRKTFYILGLKQVKT